VSVTVPQARAEEARAVMLELFPGGFEEVGGANGLELAAYTDAGGEERLWHAFGSAAAAPVPEDWPDRWKRFHQPVRVGRLWVGPPWEEPPGDAIAVVVDPGRAFGTGGHPTTQLCLRLLQDVAPGSLLDVGCGSGVLAIAAAKLGYAPVLAVDADPHAVAAARANAAANGATVTTELLAAGGEPLPASDVAVANIALDAVERLAPGLRSRVVLTSGYLASERPALRGYEHRERAERDGWAADVFAAGP
jgi:ribosomal protein L11 methyltransferase